MWYYKTLSTYGQVSKTYSVLQPIFAMSMKSSSCEKPNGNLMFIYHSLECSKRGINYKWELAGGSGGLPPRTF